VTNITMAKAMCATCLLTCGVQVWSSKAVVDSEENVKLRRVVPTNLER